MDFEKISLGQPQNEVKAAMQEEGCEQCFGCTYATIIAATIVSRTNTLLDFTDKLELTDSDLHDDFEETINVERTALKGLTANCNGYAEVKRESGRPAKMCDSPVSPDSKIAVAAGRILEFLKIK